MSGALPHLVLNHLPVLGIPFSLAVLLAGLVRGRGEVVRVGLWALGLTALLSVPAFVSGSAAEEALHGQAGVSGPHIERHEESAEASLVAALLAAGLSFAALAAERRGGKTRRWALAAVLVLALATAVLMARSAHLGGQVRHSEIRAVVPAGPER